MAYLLIISIISYLEVSSSYDMNLRNSRSPSVMDLWNLSPGPASSPAPVLEGEVEMPPAI